ncbi:hypothetical protein BABINDRAFT_159561 [Babjeviella inositovora NRRL Y-12698]|uniref:Uncharacterized protein n=1 Tax=Babjeviella inositovora NRRL Y-12698 TaxID=984486 RepID=A0A1E3QZK1_9ASCO|nr:uncharacterized protein BABINDRAFT_159561 [Babjeviella inositovora NRRL Y-12698]ODQ83103.1 hypothetical protein BABINDRAFT_159561 [Babjeviella inositovora NRRL Y-12698]
MLLVIRRAVITSPIPAIRALSFTFLCDAKAPEEVAVKPLKYKHRLRAEKKEKSHQIYLEKQEKKRSQEAVREQARQEAQTAKDAAKAIHDKYYTFPKPSTPASYFIAEKVISRDEGIKANEVQVLASREWKTMGDKARQPYIIHANTMKAEWVRNMARIPRLPATMFAKYVKESSIEFTGSALSSEVMKKLTERWRKMPEMEKELYRAPQHEMDAALEAREIFEAERRKELGE